MSFIRPGRDYGSAAPVYLASALVADNEDEGVLSRTLTLAGVTSTGLTLLAWASILTANFAGPPTLNNGNELTQVFSQDYGPTYTNWSQRGYQSYDVAGGSDHATTLTKDSGTLSELTFAFAAISGGTIVSSSVVNRLANGAGAVHTSDAVTATKPALLIATGSGTGDPNATAPTQTWPTEWQVRQSVARTSSQDASGHVPFYLATRTVGAGSYTVQVQTTIDEGILLAVYAIQLP